MARARVASLLIKKFTDVIRQYCWEMLNSIGFKFKNYGRNKQDKCGKAAGQGENQL